MDEWRKRELRTQGMIMSTVDKGLVVDLRTFKTAPNMWIFLAMDMQLMTSKNRMEVDRKLRNVMLRPNATPEKMTPHLQAFNILWLEAYDFVVPLRNAIVRIASTTCYLWTSRSCGPYSSTYP